METMVTPYHLQLTNGWYLPHVECARPLEVGWLIGVTFIYFHHPDSPHSRATSRWGITVTTDVQTKQFIIHLMKYEYVVMSNSANPRRHNMSWSGRDPILSDSLLKKWPSPDRSDLFRPHNQVVQISLICL